MNPEDRATQRKLQIRDIYRIQYNLILFKYPPWGTKVPQFHIEIFDFQSER